MKTSNPLLAIKLRNLLPTSYGTKLSNIVINGDKRGCSGFVNHDGKTVYVNTEACSTLGYMARTASNHKDFRGGRNHFAKTPEALVTLVADLLKQPHVQA